MSDCGNGRCGGPDPLAYAPAGPSSAVAADADHDHADHDHADHDNADHDHGVGPGADIRYLTIALALIVAFMLAEVTAALLSGSLALLADAGHMLTDVAALGAGVWAARLAARPASEAWTYGLKRAEILTAAVNGVSLAVVAVVIVVQAIGRLLHPASVAGGVVLSVALVGVVVNILATLVLARADRTRLNVRGAFAHLLTDLYAFLGAAGAGLVIMLTGWLRADPLASLAVAALMARAAWGLLRDSGRILLQAVPDHVDLAEVRVHLARVDHVVDVHDLHAWTITSGLPTLTVHIVVDDHCFASGHAPLILDRVQACLEGHFDVGHSTVQLEPAAHAAHEPGRHS